MKLIISLLASMFAISILFGCTSGYKFNYERYADLDIYKVKNTEYRNIFGKPFEVSDMYASGNKYEIVWYHYGYHPFGGNLFTRNLLLEFRSEELNGYLYASSFADDKTVADLTKMGNIKIGVSTKDDITSLLGKPYGKALCPSQLGDFKDNCANAKEIWEWYAFKFGYTNKLIEKKYIIIMFGEDGKVADFKAADIKD